MIDDHFVLFDSRYATELHPAVLPNTRHPRPHPDGWVTIRGARSFEDARRVTFGLFGARWSDVIDAPPSTALFPLGALAVYDATANRWEV